MSSPSTIRRVTDRDELEESEILDLVAGAKTGATMYLRMARWAMELPELANEFA